MLDASESLYSTITTTVEEGYSLIQGSHAKSLPFSELDQLEALWLCNSEAEENHIGQI